MKRIKTFCACLVTATILVGCGAVASGCGNKNEKLEIVSATLTESEYTQDWIYVDNDKVNDYVNYPPTLRYILDVTFKKPNGETKNGEVDAYMSMDSQVYLWKTRDYFVDLSYSQLDNATVGNDKELTITISSNPNSLISSGECQVKVNYDVLHALKSGSLDAQYKTDYSVGEAFDVSSILYNATYEDDSTEAITFDRLINMPQFKDQASITAADTSTVGLHKYVKISYPKSGSGSTTGPLYYNVLPDSNWEKQTVDYSGNKSVIFYKTANMETGELRLNGVDFTTVKQGNIDICMALGSGLVRNPDKTTFENALNSSSQSLFHAILPANHTAKVNSAEKISHKYYKVEYDVNDANGTKARSDILYFVFESAGSLMLPVTVRNAQNLTADELETVKEFIETVWFG